MYKKGRVIEGVIFDLDGIIIDSEPFWEIAAKKVFKSIGIEFTSEICRQTTGLDSLSTIRYVYSIKPWNDITFKQVAAEIIREVLALIMDQGKAKEGVHEIISFLNNLKIPVAVASSSEMKIIQTVLEKIKLKDKFAAVCSSEHEEFGKPHPAVYLAAAKLLNIEPEKCLAFEDSFFGALAAKSARMKVVAVLSKTDFTETRFDFTDMKVRSLEDFGLHEFELLNRNINH